MRRLWLALLAILALALPGAAQDTGPGAATLVADRISIAADTRLLAEGHVEVLWRGTRLRATSISFDRSTGLLQIVGPITLVQGDNLILLADSAELSRDLQQGILRSARMVLNRQLQLGAAEINRVGGRYTALTRAVASSCQVCAANPVPLWEIRAARVVHDQQERQLYFDHAQFRVAGVPVFYIPRLRMPDPSLKRATGFLMPQFRSTSTLGPGLKLPYFIAIGDSRDLTLIPYVSTVGTRTLDLRYRQALRGGTLQFDGALTDDVLIPGETRGYLFGTVSMALQGGYQLQFDLQAVSDGAYLLDYGHGQVDRLRSAMEVRRTSRTSHFSAGLSQFTSIRQGEDNATLPGLVGEVTLHRRFRPAVLGGEGGFWFQTYALARRSSVDQIGRDTARASARIDWRRNWTLPLGINLSAIGALSADIYAIGQDSSYPAIIVRSTPIAAVELRWPWIRTVASGASQVIEPVVQLIYSPDDGAAVPNEDSTLVEFDEGNLFALNRFPGEDVTERGLRANIGVGWTRFDPAGWSASATLGRVFRLDDPGQFSAGSGLAGAQSDWLAAVQLRTDGGISLTNRAIFDSDFNFTKDELRLGINTDRLALSTSYLWLAADPGENRPTDTTEWAMAADYALGSQWSGSFNWRYDQQAGRATSAGLGLAYRTECVTLDLSLSRRFTSSTSVTPTTDFGLSVDLVGFGGKAEAGAVRRSCRR